MNDLPLPQYNYPAGTIIEIDGRPHRPPVQHIPGRLTIIDCHTGQPFLVPDGNGGTMMPTHDDFDRLLIDDRIEVKFAQNVLASRALATKAEWDLSDLEKFDPGIRKVIAQVELLDSNGVKNGVLAIAKGLAEHWTKELQEQFGDPDRPENIKRWRMKSGKPGARDLRLLVRLSGNVARRPHDAEIPKEIRTKHAMAAMAAPDRINMKAAFSLAQTELIEVNEGRSALYCKPETPYPLFSYATFRRDCIAIDGSEFVAERDGKQMVESAMRGGGKPLTASRILEKVIIDHTPLDAFVVVDLERDVVAGRPWLTLAIDVYSRAIVAWVITFRPPSYWTVCECLRRMNLPKRPPAADANRYSILKRICGKPTELVLDNAGEFTGHGLEDAAKCGSFSVRFCPIKKPRYRAIGERAIGTFQRRMLEHLPGATRPIAETDRSGHDAPDKAVATMNELEALANKTAAEYHVEPHEGINNLQPALLWQRSANRHGIDVMADLRRFRLETFETKSNVKVTKSGVRIFNGLRYHCAIGVPRLINNCLRFEPRRQKRVDATIHTKIKFDPDNIAVIHVWDKTTKTYVDLKCADETYADGMPLWFHKELVELAKADATGAPKSSATSRRKSKPQKADAELKRIADTGDDEITPKGFNTEAERLESRARRIAAIRAIKPGARHRERLTLARLYDIPRVRAITGNIVHLDTDFARSATTDDFIAHDVSALTMLDQEILAPRPGVAAARPRTGKGDRRALGAPRKSEVPFDQKTSATATRSRRRNARG